MAGILLVSFSPRLMQPGNKTDLCNLAVSPAPVQAAAKSNMVQNGLYIKS